MKYIRVVITVVFPASQHIGAGTRMEQLPKLLASTRAHKAHFNQIKKQNRRDCRRHSYSQWDYFTQVARRPAEKKRDKPSRNVTIRYPPEDLEAEILDAEELDSLIVEKVCITDNLIELAKGNPNQQPRVISETWEYQYSGKFAAKGTGKSTTHSI